MDTLTATNYSFRKLGVNKLETIAHLVHQINPSKPIQEVIQSLRANFKYNNYFCIGFYDQDHLVGLTSCWTTSKVYSGKQLEVDNVIIDKSFQSRGYGKIFFELIEQWAKENGYKSVELNTYIENDRSHKFYFNQGYKIGGYHFLKALDND